MGNVSRNRHPGRRCVLFCFYTYLYELLIFFFRWFCRVFWSNYLRLERHKGPLTFFYQVGYMCSTYWPQFVVVSSPRINALAVSFWNTTYWMSWILECSVRRYRLVIVLPFWEHLYFTYPHSANRKCLQYRGLFYPCWRRRGVYGEGWMCGWVLRHCGTVCIFRVVCR